MTKYEPREHVIDSELANGNRSAWRQILGFPCLTCNGRGLVGGFVSADSGYQDDPCPDCRPAVGGSTKP